MRGYFIRVPKWARLMYSSAIWTKADLDFAHDGALWTIDDGPDPESTPQWLELLDHMQIKAIFFLLGEKSERHPQLVDAIRAAGHIIGSHGYKHLDGWKTDNNIFVDDARRGIEISEAVYYRPPYGRMTRQQHKEISSISKIMMWSVMPGDFDHNVDKEVLSQRLKGVHEEDIVVMHDDFSSVEKYSYHVRRGMISN